MSLLDGSFRIQMPHQLRGNSRLCYIYQDRYDPSIAILPYIVSPGMRVIDIGAHYGIYSIVLSQLCGSTGAVFAYEPIPEFCIHLEKNIALYKLHNIQVIQVALSDRDGSGEIRSHRDRSRTSIRTVPEGTKTTFARVQLAKLDNGIENTRSISFIKIDTEGNDGRVIDGMSQLLLRDKPIVQVEILDLTSKNEIREKLSKVGYELLSMSDFCNLMSIPRPKNAEACANHYGVHNKHAKR